MAHGRPSVRDLAGTTHDGIGGSGAPVKRVMGLRAMRNGLNEGRQAASSQDLCAKLAMVARLVGGGAVDHVALATCGSCEV